MEAAASQYSTKGDTVTIMTSKEDIIKKTAINELNAMHTRIEHKILDILKTQEFTDDREHDAEGDRLWFIAINAINKIQENYTS